MRELFCRYIVIDKGIRLYSGMTLPPIANRRRRGANGNITSMPGMGTLEYEKNEKPYQVTILTPRKK